MSRSPIPGDCQPCSGFRRPDADRPVLSASQCSSSGVDAPPNQSGSGEVPTAVPVDPEALTWADASPRPRVRASSLASAPSTPSVMVPVWVAKEMSILLAVRSPHPRSAARPFEHVKYEIQKFVDPIGDPKRATRDPPLWLVAAY